MNSIQITKILESNPQTSQVFKGCLSCDQLPDYNSIKYPTAFILNLDPQHLEGSHWVAIYAEGKEKPINYFDSLTLFNTQKPKNGCIINKFLKQFPQILRNCKPYQSPLAKTCAHHCICFIFFLSQNCTFNEYTKMLNNEPYPDLFVKKFVDKMIKYLCSSIYYHRKYLDI